MTSFPASYKLRPFSSCVSPGNWGKLGPLPRIVGKLPATSNWIASLRAINPQIKIAYHTDGVVYPIIPELIEIGVDVLNPVQPLAMDPEKLKESYSHRLCFWGSIDLQHTLPFGTPNDVKNEVITRLKSIGKGGGLIIGPTHNLQLDTPLENFWALVDTIQHTPYHSIS